MKILYSHFTDEDKHQLTAVIYSNTLTTMKTLLGQASFFGYEDTIVDAEAKETVRSAKEQAEVDVKLGTAIKSLWGEKAIQQTWDRRSEYQIVDSMAYFFENIDSIMQTNYMASPQDILHVRIRSTGIVTDVYNVDNTIFEMYDVGGQRNERKKWIHCFDNVTAVIYVAALSGYDQGLFEDHTTNRLTEAINLFKEICENPYFNHSSIILFLNKRDLFAEKIKVKAIYDVPEWSDYKGNLGDFESATQYFLAKFLAASRHAKTPDGETKSIFYHVTCATDTENVRVVFNSCKDSILRNNLVDSGFL
ncbi:unnamed protein product [Chrysoparadoxa australica]